MDKHDNTFAENLARIAIKGGLDKVGFLNQFKNKIMQHEKDNGRENGCAYVAADSYDKVFAEIGFPLFHAYLKARKQNGYTLSARQALLRVRSEEKFKAWKEKIGAKNFYTNGENIAHEYEKDGIRYVFKIEYDDHPFYEDIKAQGYDIDWKEARGYWIKPDFAEHGNFTRWKRGQGFDFCIGFSPENDRSYYYAIGSVPDSFIEQFKTGKNWNDAVKRARAAIEQDIKNYLCGSFHYVSVTAYDAETNEEIASDALGGCDNDYCTSGRVFYEHGMLETVMKEAEKHVFDKNWSENAHCYHYGNFNQDRELRV